MPLTVELTDALGLPLHYLRETIAASAKFQEVTGAANATEAKAYIALAGADDRECNDDGTANYDFVPRPRVIIRWPDTVDTMQSAHEVWSWGGGRLVMAFEFDTPAAYIGHFQDAYADFINKLGAILTQMKARANQGGYLTTKQFAIGPIGQAFPEENNGQEYFCAHVMVSFGGLA